MAPVLTKALPAPKGFTFGCDPEAFVFKGDMPVTAAGLIPGTKREPYRVEKGWVQVDGMAAEINIDPASTFKDFSDNIETVIKQLTTMLPKDHSLRWIPSVEFSPDAFYSAPDSAKELGCQPDFDVYTGDVNPPPWPDNPFVRCCGGHLHIGWTEDEDVTSLQHILNCQDLGKQLDWYLAAWSLTKDADTIRRTLYGKLGACRYKPYGMEYRVLSNFWVPDKDLHLQVWNRTVHAIAVMSKIFLPDRVPNELFELLKTSVNTSKLHPTLAEHCTYPIKTTETSYNRW